MPRFRCPSCRARLTAPAVVSGRSGHCPSCDREVRVPVAIERAPHPVLVWATYVLGALLLAFVAVCYYSLKHAQEFTEKFKGPAPVILKPERNDPPPGWPGGMDPIRH